MREIGVLDAETKLGTLLDWVAKGEEIIITRHGKAVARLVPESSVPDRTKSQQAAANIRTRRVGVTLGGLSIKDLVNAGRP